MTTFSQEVHGSGGGEPLELHVIGTSHLGWWEIIGGDHRGSQPWGTPALKPLLFMVLQGPFGVKFSFCLLLLKSATTSPPRTKSTKWGTQSNPPRATECKTGSSGDGCFSLKLIESRCCHTFPSNLLSSPQLPKSLKAFSSPSDHFPPARYFCLRPVVSTFLGEDSLKWRVFFFPLQTKNGEHARVRKEETF